MDGSFPAASIQANAPLPSAQGDSIPKERFDLDFWDLTVVIFRRWKVSLPLLLVAIGATAFVAVTIKPDYTMTSYVQLIPAKVSPTDNPISASVRNPWNQLGLNTIAQAAIYSTQDQKFLDSLKAAHHTDNFTLTMNYPNPIVTVQVVAPTSADARLTTDLVVTRLRDSVESLQKQAGVQDQDIIATQRLDQGENLEAAGGKAKRAMAAVAAAGLLVMAGGALAFDALARRRSRRRHEREEAQSPPQETAATGTINGTEPKLSAEPAEPASEPQNSRKTIVIAENGATRPVSGVGAVRSTARAGTAIVVRPTASVVKRSSPIKSARSPDAATYVSMNAQGKADDADHNHVMPATNGDAAVMPADVQVVLQPTWVDGKNGKRP
jgi:hypothetical protein